MSCKQWAPIETAPDGIVLLLWIPSDILPSRGLYEARKLGWPREDRATHWQFLPAPPCK